MRALPLLCCCCTLLAQEPKPPQELQRLADRLDAVHRPAGKAQPIESFAAALVMEEVAAEEQRFQVELKAQFLDWREPGKDRPKGLIRYTLAGTDRHVERGRDQDGFWLWNNGAVVSMPNKDFTTDYDAVQRDVRLARQLLRFLDPAAVLRSLQNPTPVREEPLKVGRYEPQPCLVVSGRLATFPLLHAAGDDHAVQLTVYVDRDRGQLAAILTLPLDPQGVPLQEQGEFIRFDDQRAVTGVLLPHKLEYSTVDAEGKRHKQLEVRITTITLGPALRAEDFDRQKRWSPGR
ncbi:MAG TPA: hypothetical protein VK348_01990 [Planctomycetota bacterium]|nr:hypothetical protein [Planctomycetota bacterium]